ncbi:MAG: acetyl-CoA hydrolase [Hyphomicrobiales bacterium]|nr:acetyl-CoA hydrolase [Hyphomicrobiales bacterium]MCP5372459.1 acetyl-CoA hydrolase [Hyphomicrobiales bacterium]
MPQICPADAFPGLLRPGMTVYLPASGAEPLALRAALQAQPEAARGVDFLAAWVPGINDFDYAALHAEARATAFFVLPAMRESFRAGKVRVLPLNYAAIARWLRDDAAIDLAVVHVAPPDARGLCSTGILADFSSLIWDKAATVVGLVNPAMPRVRGAPAIAYDRLDVVVEDATPLLTLPRARVDATYAAIGRRVAELVDDGTTLQFGVGSLQAAVLESLTGHRDLRLVGGMVSDPLLDLDASGALSPTADVVATLAIGSRQLYDWCGSDPRTRFAPVTETHNVAGLSTIDNFFACNGALQVDLFGQVNGESLNGRLVSGPGGLPDYLRSGAMARGGRAVVALPSSAKGGQVSRIVPCLAAGTPVSAARCDAGTVVTEHGAADLRGLDLDARAEALIAIAEPAHREDLAGQWADLRARL